jgi:hypothetical protein
MRTFGEKCWSAFFGYDAFDKVFVFFAEDGRLNDRDDQQLPYSYCVQNSRKTPGFSDAHFKVYVGAALQVRA